MVFPPFFVSFIIRHGESVVLLFINFQTFLPLLSMHQILIFLFSIIFKIIPI
ncbi:hypothetical protein HMPREF0908_0319 [Selenomonas flueggei ATCC 43531]|uniref:Uncharacterized protein n=1 Tax=Selenomonas flueggei ATCC 43531 TaxID=638302 RepID=C4V1C5_9FIRM|nr:hypothetical protein HMPREF0908_0319 [Selenomonas flueggei ATCC 43531]